MLATLALVREKKLETKLNLDKIEQDAQSIRRHTATERPTTIAATELRDRAYTALRQAVDDAQG